MESVFQGSSGGRVTCRMWYLVGRVCSDRPILAPCQSGCLAAQSRTSCQEQAGVMLLWASACKTCLQQPLRRREQCSCPQQH